MDTIKSKIVTILATEAITDQSADLVETFLWNMRLPFVSITDGRRRSVAQLNCKCQKRV